MAVQQTGRRRLVDDLVDLEACRLCRPLRPLACPVAELDWNGDDRPLDGLVE
jgi:hypothetical protein